MVNNSLRNVCFIYSTYNVSCLFFKRVLMIVINVFVARYLRRIWVSKCANKITIRGPYRWNVIIYISHEMERREKDLWRSCFLGEGTQSTVLEWQRERMKNGMKEMLLFVTLWYHTALYVGDDIRRMFLKALEGFSFSVGNISNCDNFVMTPYLFCTFYVCYHNQ